MSTATLAPAVATTETVFPSPGADPKARFLKRIDAELRLAKLERDVQRLEDHLFAPSRPLHPVRRRSRRSAWLPSDLKP